MVLWTVILTSVSSVWVCTNDQKITRNHKTLTLAEVREGALSQVEQKQMCLEHEGEELKITAGPVKALSAGTAPSSPTRDMTMCSSRMPRQKIVRKLQQLLLQVEKKYVEFQKCITDVETEIAAEKESMSKCEEQVNKYFNEYIQKIERHKASLLNKLHHNAMNVEKVLVTEKEDLEFTKARLTSAIAFTTQLLSSGNMADIAHLSKQTSEQLRSLTKLKKQHDVEQRTWHFVQKEKPTECFVQVSIRPSFVNPPTSVPHGLNEIDIRAPARPNVSITTDSGIPCMVTGITPTTPSSWRVTYVIPAPPLTNSVHITVRALEEKASMRLACIQTLALGTRVVDIDHMQSSPFVFGHPRRVGCCKGCCCWFGFCVGTMGSKSRTRGCIRFKTRCIRSRTMGFIQFINKCSFWSVVL